METVLSTSKGNATQDSNLVLVLPVRVGNHNHLTIECVIDERHRSLIFDTGSPISFLKANDVPICDIDEWDLEKITTINGVSETVGSIYYETRISLLNRHKWADIKYNLVKDMPFDGILGMDAISKFGITAAFEDGDSHLKFTQDEPRIRMSALNRFANLLSAIEGWNPMAFLMTVSSMSVYLDEQQNNDHARFSYNNESYPNFKYQDVVEYTEVETNTRGIYIISKPIGLEHYELLRVRDGKFVVARMNEIAKIQRFNQIQQQQDFLQRYFTVEYDDFHN